ncbi:MAG: isoleucine--tRNA ligase [Rhodoblastus sp.]|nr:isoleucine--tRNA ligase [Rhodoblastus sp.]
MNDMPKAAKADKTGPDYSASLFLPQTEFPMRAGLPKKEPEILARWNEIDLYKRLREAGKGRKKFVLHDGPPYANGAIHIGHALNKTLKDLVTRSQQMLNKDSNYVPGWDCHGLPIEWKIEEENYRSKGKAKPDLRDSAAMIAFRRECRAYADHWVNVQREEFKRLGVVGDWDNPYLTMTYPAEAQIARELLKFAENGLLYRGSKPVMWSVVEKTALAEAEVEYEDHTSDTVWVAFPITTLGGYLGEASTEEAASDASVVIWTTTPWTLPGNRAICFSSKISYGLYRVTAAPEDNWAKVGAKYVLADKLAEEVFKSAKVEAWERLSNISAETMAGMECAHPLAGLGGGYDFRVPLLSGDHVTDDTGTGFVHTAPGHGREDFEIWMASGRMLTERKIETRIPYTVDEDSFYTKEAPGFDSKRVITDKGDKGDANDAVIKALVERGALIARGRLKHQYPHSWRSKKPVIFRNTPQWFVAMDKPFVPNDAGSPSPRERGEGVRRTDEGQAAQQSSPAAPHPGPLPASGEREGMRSSLRAVALEEITRVRWEPASGQNRITGMIAAKPDWVMSRQRAWGVPIAVFVRKGEHTPLVDAAVNKRIGDAFEAEGADAWFAEGAKARFLAPDHNPDDFDKVDDVLDVWFDSGSTHAFVLEDAKHFPGLQGVHRIRDGGADEVMYLEGSDQHRGWFHSSLLESCGTRGRAPYDVVLTHGFTLDEHGRKMSKSQFNALAPDKLINELGADILRLWAASVDYSDDQRLGPEILKFTTDNYRKLRNTIRWMLGSLAHFSEGDRVDWKGMPELERLMLHRLAEVDAVVQQAYADFDYKKVVATVTPFMTGDCSAFYFDIRKDALYCEAPSSHLRKSALTVVDAICDAVLKWLAPILVFTTDEAWAMFRPNGAPSVHLEIFPAGLGQFRDDALAERWRKIRRVRSVVTGALEIERANKAIGSSLEAAPVVFISDAQLRDAVVGVDMAEICITSDVTIEPTGDVPEGAFVLPDTPGVAVAPAKAQGRKCARSWKISPLVGSDPEFPDVTPRDAAALRELKAQGRWGAA